MKPKTKTEELQPCYRQDWSEGEEGVVMGRHFWNFNGVCGGCGQYCEEKDTLKKKYENPQP